MKPQRLVLVLAAVLFLWNLGGAHDFWAPDEPYFAEGAREMVVDGEWIVPHVNGVVTTDKPPLFFWLIALGSLVVGEVTPWTGRLPSALASLGTLLLILRLGRRMGGARVAWLASLILTTTVMFWEKARWVQIDALLCFLIWVALSAFEAWRAGDADGRRAGLLFWLAAGLAVLAKGPVGLLLPLGIALVTLATDRQLGRWREFAPLTGPLLFFGLAGTWAAVASSAPDYSVLNALREHFVDRAIHGMHHVKPPWYFLEQIPIHVLPWTGLLPGALLLAWRRRREPADRFLLVVFLFVLVFFSISTEKRHLYALPAVPALALLFARFVDTVATDLRERVAGARVSPRWLLVGQGVVGGILAMASLALPIAAHRQPEVEAWKAIGLALVLAVTGIVTVWACRQRRAVRSTVVLAGGIAVFYLFASTFVFPIFDQWKSAKELSQRLRAHTEASYAEGRQLVALDLGNIPEALAFYGDGLYSVTTRDPELVIEHLRQPGEAWAMMKRKAYAALPADVLDRIEIVESSDLSREDLVLVVNRRRSPSAVGNGS